MTENARINLVTFDIFRSIGIPNVAVMKPEEIFAKRPLVDQADWVLFPPYSLLNLVAYGFQKSIFPSPSTYHLGYDKIQIVRAFMARFPGNTPQTLIYPNTDFFREQILDQLEFPFVAKEIRNARGQGTFLIQNRKSFLDYAANNDVLYAQEYLPIQRDLRVIWVADRIVLAYWRIAPAGEFLNNVAAGAEISYEDIPQGALDLVTSVCHNLNINYAGFDVAEVFGHFYLFEYNLFFGTQALTDEKISLGPLIFEYLSNHHRLKNDPKKPPFSIAV